METNPLLWVARSQKRHPEEVGGDDEIQIAGDLARDPDKGRVGQQRNRVGAAPAQPGPEDVNEPGAL